MATIAPERRIRDFIDASGSATFEVGAPAIASRTGVIWVPYAENSPGSFSTKTLSLRGLDPFTGDTITTVPIASSNGSLRYERLALTFSADGWAHLTYLATDSGSGDASLWLVRLSESGRSLQFHSRGKVLSDQYNRRHYELHAWDAGNREHRYALVHSYYYTPQARWYIEFHPFSWHQDEAYLRGAGFLHLGASLTSDTIPSLQVPPANPAAPLAQSGWPSAVRVTARTASNSVELFEISLDATGRATLDQTRVDYVDGDHTAGLVWRGQAEPWRALGLRQRSGSSGLDLVAWDEGSAEFQSLNASVVSGMTHLDAAPYTYAPVQVFVADEENASSHLRHAMMARSGDKEVLVIRPTGASGWTIDRLSLVGAGDGGADTWVHSLCGRFPTIAGVGQFGHLAFLEKDGTHFNLVLVNSYNKAPDAPQLLSPTPSSIIDPGQPHAFTWAHSDPDGSDQAAYRFKLLRHDDGTVQWWDATSGTFGASEVDNATSVEEVTFPAGTFAEGSSYSWYVATYDGFDWGPYASRTFTGGTPPTVSVDAPYGTISSTTRPTVRWTFQDVDGQDQTLVEVKIFEEGTAASGGFNPETSPAVWEFTSGNSALRQVTPSVDLVDGVEYRVYVRCGTEDGQLSGFISSYFSLQLDTPEPPQVTAVADDEEGTVRVELRGQHDPVEWDTVRYLVERSTDGGTTWQFVRGATDGLVPDGALAAHVVDLEVPAFQQALYRAATQDWLDETALVTGGWSPAAEAELQSLGLTLVDLFSGERFSPLRARRPAAETLTSAQSVLQPIGSAFPTVVHDSTTGGVRELDLVLQGAEEWQTFQRFYGLGRPVFVRIHGEGFYATFGSQAQVRVRTDFGQRAQGQVREVRVAMRMVARPGPGGLA